MYECNDRYTLKRSKNSLFTGKQARRGDPSMKKLFFPHEGTKYKCVTYVYLHLQVLRKLTKFNGSRNYNY